MTKSQSYRRQDHVNNLYLWRLRDMERQLTLDCKYQLHVTLLHNKNLVCSS